MNFSKKVFYEDKLFYAVFPIIIVLAKIIRYTVLKKSTVDAGIGHHFIEPMLNTDIHYMFLWDKATAANGAVTGGAATNNAMWVFQKFNWLGFTTYEGFEVGITIVFNAILLYLLHSFLRSKQFMDLGEMCFLAFCVGVLNIYTFVLSKEPVQMLYFMMLFFVLRTDMEEAKKWMWCIVALMIIIVASRTYFVLMLMFALGIRWMYIPVTKWFKGKFIYTFAFLLLLSGVAYMAFLFVCQGARPDDFAELIRVRLRNAEGTTTVIQAVIPSENIPMFSVNYVITILRLLFPVELVRFGPQYMVFVLFQLMISVVAISSLKNYADCSPTKKIATCIFWGYILCSATFEPDFGSWIRHESATIPFMLFMLEKNEEEEEENEEENYTNSVQDCNSSSANVSTPCECC